MGWVTSSTGFTSKKIINIGLLASLAGMALIGWADVPWIFISAAGLYGLGISPIWIYCLTKVKEESRGAQMGFLYMIWLVGLGSGPVVLNLVLVHSEIASYWIMVLVSAGAWLLSLMIPKEAHADVAAVPFRKQLAVLGTHLKDMRLLLPGMILQTLAAGMLQPILPSFVKDHLGMASWQYTLLLLAGGGFTALGLIPMGRLSDRLGKKWFLVVGFILFGVALYGLTLGPVTVLAFVWAVTLGLSYAAVLPAWNALLAAYVPPDQKGSRLGRTLRRRRRRRPPRPDHRRLRGHGLRRAVRRAQHGGYLRGHRRHLPAVPIPPVPRGKARTAHVR
ncbi:MFS transporter [Cohnella ginsengisoli]|uniref:MFS transporter n=1 Tax=Cohnella ginsengisoli TaxID=425004 RepID=UPI0030B8D9C1